MHQAHVVDYLREENRLLKQQLRGQRLRLTDDQRRRLAAKGILLGRKLLAQIATIVTPETLLARHRKLVSREERQRDLELGQADEVINATALAPLTLSSYSALKRPQSMGVYARARSTTAGSSSSSTTMPASAS